MKAQKILEEFGELNEVRMKPENMVYFKSTSSLMDDKLIVNMLAQTPERAYNDRDVYLKISLKNEDGSVEAYKPMTTWIKGEEAIELGLMLAEAGNKSLEYNRCQVYETIEILAARSGMSKGIFDKVTITRKSDEQPNNYGAGYYYFDFVYHSKTNKEEPWTTRMINDVVIYWSPFEDEYKKQLKNYVENLPYELVGWSWEIDIRDAFERWSRKMKKEQESQKGAEKSAVEFPIEVELNKEKGK